MKKTVFNISVIFLVCLKALKSLAAPISQRSDDSRAVADSSSALSYLVRFGYIPSSKNSSKAFLLTEEGVSRALRRLQKFGGISESGVLDTDTRELINTPRCGLVDVLKQESREFLDIGGENTDENANVETGEETRNYFPNGRKRRKRYAVQGSRWKTYLLSYKIGKYPTRFSKEEVEAEVRKAFGMWSKYSELTFYHSRGGNVHIEIRFEDGHHGDEDPFDGPGGVVAHAFFPEFGGDAHFDNKEFWTINRYTGTSLLQSLTHELGHSLGLLHSSTRDAMMAPYHRGWDPNLKLHKDDISAIQSLYGGKRVTKTSSRSTNRGRRRG